jgi:hypothetical protein
LLKIMLNFASGNTVDGVALEDNIKSSYRLVISHK